MESGEIDGMDHVTVVACLDFWEMRLNRPSMLISVVAL